MSRFDLVLTRRTSRPLTWLLVAALALAAVSMAGAARAQGTGAGISSVVFAVEDLLDRDSNGIYDHRVGALRFGGARLMVGGERYDTRVPSRLLKNTAVRS